MMTSALVYVYEIDIQPQHVLRAVTFTVRPLEEGTSYDGTHWDASAQAYVFVGERGGQYELTVTWRDQQQTVLLTLPDEGIASPIEVVFSPETILYSVEPGDFTWRFQWEHRVAHLPYAWDLLGKLQPSTSNPSHHGPLKFGNGELVLNIMDQGINSAYSLSVGNTSNFPSGSLVVITTASTTWRSVVLYIKDSRVVVHPIQRGATGGQSYTQGLIRITAGSSTIAPIGSPQNAVTITSVHNVPAHPDFAGQVVFPDESNYNKMVAWLDHELTSNGMLPHHHIGTGQHGNKCAGVAVGGETTSSSVGGNADTFGITGVAPNVRLIGTKTIAPGKIPSNITNNSIVDHFLLKWLAGFDVRNWLLFAPSSAMQPSTYYMPNGLSRLRENYPYIRYQPNHLPPAIDNSIAISSHSTSIASNVSPVLRLMTSFGRNRKGILLFQSVGNSNTIPDDNELQIGSSPWGMYVAAATLSSSGFEQRAAYSNWKLAQTVGTAAARDRAIDFCAPSGTNHKQYLPPKSYRLSSVVTTNTEANDARKGDMPYNKTLSFTLSSASNAFSTIYLYDINLTSASSPSYIAGTTTVDLLNGTNTVVLAGLVVFSIDGNSLMLQTTATNPPEVENGFRIRATGTTMTYNVFVADYISPYPKRHTQLQHPTLNNNQVALREGTLLTFGTITGLKQKRNLSDLEFAKIIKVNTIGSNQYAFVLDRSLSMTYQQLVQGNGSISVSIGENINHTFGGTSGATPFAAGIAALVLTANPKLTYAETRQIMRDTAIPIDLWMVQHPWLEINGTSSTSILTNQWLLNVSPVAGANLIEASIVSITNGEGPFNLTSINYDIPEVTKLRILPIGSINIAHFQAGQALLVGAESTLTGIGSGTITVADGSGFRRQQNIVINAGPVAYLTRDKYIGENELRVTHTDGFRVGQQLRITDAQDPNKFETITISNFATKEYKKKLSAGVIILTSSLTNHYSNFSEVRPLQEEVLITNISGNTLTIAPALTNTYPTTSGSFTIVRTKYAFVAAIHSVNQGNSELYLYPKLPAKVFGYLQSQINAGHVNLVRQGLRPDYSPALGHGRVDGFLAVHAAVTYNHNERDLIIRNSLEDDGTSKTNYVESIESPDIWVVNQGLSITERLHWEQHYDETPTHEKPNRKNRASNNFNTKIPRKVYVRVKNRGTVESHDFSVQVYLAMIRIGNPITIDNAYQWGHSYKGNLTVDPITGFDDADLSTEGACIILRQDGQQIALDPTTSNRIREAEKELLFVYSRRVGRGAPSHPENKPNPLNPNSAVVLEFDWPEDIKPDLNKWYNQVNTSLSTVNTSQSAGRQSEFKFYLLAEVTPHDGVLDGTSPYTNSNISYREVHLWQRIRYYSYLGASTYLDRWIGVEEGKTIDIPFVILIDDESPIDTNGISLDINMHTDSMANMNVRYRYTGPQGWSIWDRTIQGQLLPISMPTWLELAPPVATDEPNTYYLSGVLKDVSQQFSSFSFRTRVTSGGVQGINVHQLDILKRPKITFFKTNATEPLESAIFVNNNSVLASIPFGIELQHTAPQDFDTSAIQSLTITIKSAAGVTTPYTFRPATGNFTSWSASPAGGITLQVAQLPATGNTVNTVTFTGTILLPTNLTDLTSINIQLVYEEMVNHRTIQVPDGGSAPHLRTFEHTIDVVDMGDATRAFEGGGTPQLLGTQSIHIFAELEDASGGAQLVPQKGFGKIDKDNFQLTSLWQNSSSAAIPAFAALSGFVFLQKASNGTYTLVLRPLFQSTVGFTRVKYFVYRGLAASYFEDATDPLLLRTVTTPANNREEDLLSSVWHNHQIRYAGATTPALTLADMGYDPVNQNPQATLDAYFGGSETPQQLAFAKRGMIVGQIGAGASIGFEIVLAEDDYSPTLVDLQVPEHILNIPTGMDDNVTRHRRTIVLHYVDPATYYGIHFWEAQNKVLVPDLSVATPHDNNSIDTTPLNGQQIYDHVLMHFAMPNRNRVYIDIRNKNGYPYDYYDQYGRIIGAKRATVHLETGVSPNNLAQYGFHPNSWPIFYLDEVDLGIQAGTSAILIFIKLNNDNLYDSVLFAEYGYPDAYNAEVKDNKFVEVKANDPMPALNFPVPLATAGGTTVVVTSIIKLRYFKKVDAGTLPPTSNNRILPSTHFTDHVFGPLTAAYSRVSIIDVTHIGNTSGVHELAITVSQNYATLLQDYEYLDLIQVSSNSNNLVDRFEIVVHTPNGTPENHVTVNVNAQTNAVTTVVHIYAPVDLSNAATYPLNQLYIELWGEQHKAQKTKWEVGTGTKLVDLFSDPSVRSMYVANTGVGIEQDLKRVLFFATAQDFLQKDNSNVEDNKAWAYAYNAVLPAGGSETTQSLFEALEQMRPNLSFESRIIKISQGSTDRLLPLLKLYEYEAGGEKKKVHFLGLGLTQDEFRALYKLCVDNFSTTHDWYFRLLEDPLLSNAYYNRYEVTVVGYDRNHVYASQQLSSHLYVYASADYPSIFMSDSCIGLQSFTTKKKPILAKHVFTEDDVIFQNLITATNLTGVVNSFQTSLQGLQGASNYNEIAYQLLAKNTAELLWTNTMSSTATKNDYRSLFWARLYMQNLLYEHDYGDNTGGKNSEFTDILVNLVDEYSRGITQVDFSGFTTTKKILLVAFDSSYKSNSKNEQRTTSASVGLALDGTVINGPAGNIGVQTVVLPLRYADFNGVYFDHLDKVCGVVEAAIAPYIKEVDAVVMLGVKETKTTGKPNGMRIYCVERYAAKPRMASSSVTTYDNIDERHTKENSRKEENVDAVYYAPNFDAQGVFTRIKRLRKVPNMSNMVDNECLDAKDAIQDTSTNSTLKMASANTTTDEVIVDRKINGSVTLYSDANKTSLTATSTLPNPKRGSNKNTLYNEAYYRLLILRYLYQQKTGNALSAVLLSLPNFDTATASDADLAAVTNFVKQLLIKGYL